MINAFLVGFPVSCWANLAVFSVSDIQRTGNLVPLRKSNIELVSESFTAKLNAETAQVTVDYEFVNTAGDDAVTVGFPVDLMPPAGEGTTYHLDHWQKDGLQDLRIIDGNTPLAIERSVEETLPADHRPKRLKDVAITRRWSITSLHFKARERKRVHITYVVRCMGVDEGFETEIPNKISPRTFLYTFRTAAGWGTGRIQKLNIALDATFLRQNRFPILEMEPKLTEAGEDFLRSEFQSIELSRVPDLTVTYEPKPALFQNYAEVRRLRPSNWHLGMCGPGPLAGDKLADGDARTAWIPESAKPSGTCIEIKPQHGSYINAIAILDGDYSSAANYERHARIKRVRVDYLIDLEEGRKRESFEQTFPDSGFDERVIRFPTARARFLDLSSGPQGIFQEIRVTVLELYPGTGDARLALAEIYAFGVNGKK